MLCHFFLAAEDMIVEVLLPLPATAIPIKEISGSLFEIDDGLVAIGILTFALKKNMQMSGMNR